MPETIERHAKSAAFKARPGRLVAVTCADAGRLEVLLRAAGCHLRAKISAEFVTQLATNRLPAGSGQLLKPSDFRRLAGLGALLISWRGGQHLYGYPSSILEHLASGIDVVIGAPAHLEPQLRALWPETILVRLAAGTEPLRHRLAPHITMARAATTGSRHGLVEPVSATAPTIRIEDSVNAGVAVRRLAGAISIALPVRPPLAQPVPVTRAKPPPLARRGFAQTGPGRGTAKPQVPAVPRSDAPVLV